MKNIYNYIRATFMLATVTLTLASCSPEDFTSPNEAGIPLAANYEDAVKIDINQETNTVTFSFNRSDVIPFWTVHTSAAKAIYSSKSSFTQTFAKAGDYLVEVKVLNANGQSDGVISKTVTINKSLINGFGGFVYDSAFNIWKSATISTPTFWYAPGWSQITDPVYSFQEPTYNISLPKATTDQWQAQMILGTNFGSKATSQYDFSVILTSTKAHPGVTVKLVDSSDDNIFYFAERVSLEANQPKCFWKSSMKGLDVSKLKLVLDFGGNAEGTDITVENIIFKDHANDDGTVVPKQEDPEPNWVNVNSNDNLWHGITFTNTFYYSPNWTQLPDPKLTINGTAYSTSFPSATFAQWQNQVTFVTDNLSIKPSESYDFRVILNASKDVKGVTVKFAQNDDDNVSLFIKNTDLSSGENVVLKAVNVKGVDITKAKLVFDFGGNPDDTDVIIKDIILQKHKD